MSDDNTPDEWVVVDYSGIQAFRDFSKLFETSPDKYNRSLINHELDLISDLLSYIQVVDMDMCMYKSIIDTNIKLKLIHLDN
jgi:hypothetical protein